MILVDELNNKADNYVKDKLGEEKALLGPIFRKEANQFYVGYAVIDFKDTYETFFRPTKWLILDMKTGELINFYECKDYDYTDDNNFTFNLEFENGGNSPLFDLGNYINTSFNSWKNQTLHIIDKKNEPDLKVLKIENELYSPKEYITNIVTSFFDNIKQTIDTEIFDVIGFSHTKYINETIDNIREEYIKNNKMDMALLTKYYKLLKYSWPDFIDIINHFDNILTSKNEKTDKLLKDYINKKKEKVDYNIDDLISKIDGRIAELEKDNEE